MEFEKQISKIGNDYENLEQYNQRDNLELHGVPQTAQENTNQVIIIVLASVNYKLDEKYISCSHRLPTRGKIPPIIVTFNHRDIRNSVYQVKSQLRHVDWSTTDLPEATKKVFITENLTAARKDLYFKILDQKINLNYEYLWTKNGQIFIRKSDQSPKMLIANSQDLSKMI